jgi:hypothetical protein
MAWRGKLSMSMHNRCFGCLPATCTQPQAIRTGGRGSMLCYTTPPGPHRSRSSNSSQRTASGPFKCLMDESGALPCTEAKPLASVIIEALAQHRPRCAPATSQQRY